MARYRLGAAPSNTSYVNGNGAGYWGQIPVTVGVDGVARSQWGNRNNAQIARTSALALGAVAGSAYAARKIYQNRQAITQGVRNTVSRVRNRLSSGRGASNAAQV